MANPYELRYDIYQSAKDRLNDRFQYEAGIWHNWNEWNREQEAEGKSPSAVSPVGQPEFPTHEQILIEAEKIYSFVQKKN